MKVRKQIRVGCTALSGGEATPQVKKHTAATSPALKTGAWREDEPEPEDIEEYLSWLSRHPLPKDPDEELERQHGCLDPAFSSWSDFYSYMYG